ncbi:WD40-like Beta Propeller Repeat [Aphelenchoides besseyi]|nr:WD40-like Beta Propeller Repeat [Aphelenchoides besseyi]
MKWLVFWLVFTATAGSRIHDPSEVRLKNVRQLTFGGVNGNVVFSPDGRFLVYSHKDLPDEASNQLCKQIYLLDLEDPTKRPQLLSNRFGTYESAVFLRNNVDLVVVSDVHNYGELNNKIWKETYASKTRNFDFHQLSVGRDKVPYRLTWNLPEESSVEVAAVNDQLVFVQVDGSGRRSLYRMMANATEKGKLIDLFDFVATPSFSSDGSEIVVYGRLEADSKNQLFTLTLNNPEPQELPIHNLNVSSPSFHSKENVKVLFTGTSNQTANVFVFNRETETVKQVTFLGNNSVGILSPDATKFVWSSSRNSTLDGQSNLFIADFIEYPPSEQTTLQKILNSLVSC